MITMGQPELCAGKLLSADPSPSITCTPPTLSRPAQFLSVPRGTAKYSFSGACSGLGYFDMTFEWEGSWSPSETNPNKANTVESVIIRNYDAYIDRMPGGVILAYWTGRCPDDPWLKPERNGRCVRQGAYFPNDVRDYIPNMFSESFPRTANAIPPSERQRLIAEYTKANLKAAAVGPVPGGGPPLPTSKSSVGAVTGTQCKPGFVERLAGPSDEVCVTPESRDRARQENATAASRRNPKGPYGPNTCIAGFVWREAFAGDVVCVTPEIRKLVKEENALHLSRSTGQASPTQLMRPESGTVRPGAQLIRPRAIEEEQKPSSEAPSMKPN
jgi:hypothetical protein